MKILIAIDTSFASHVALEEIIARPWPAGSTFEVLSVVEPSHLLETAEAVQEAVRHANQVVQKAIEHLQSKGWDATGGVLADDPRRVILDLAGTAGADFIVVGSHGHSDPTRFLLGSVAAAVIRYAPCSVEIVRAKRERGEGLRSMRVLLATDGSECSDLAAYSIAERPWPMGTEVRILSVAELILSATRALLELPFIGAVIESARAEAKKRSQDAIVAARKTLSTAKLFLSESDSILRGTPKAIILKEAAEWEADLIVLGSHGRRGMDRFELGSVSEAIALQAQCSVEVIRKRGSD